jgi:hypothetical protein
MPDPVLILDSSFWYEKCIYNYRKIDDDIVVKDDQGDFISAKKGGKWVGFEPPQSIKINL